jgi:3-(3-hydroxy-phenyl)propionate hydroxylase
MKSAFILSTRYDFSQHGYALTNYIADPDEWCALFKVPGHDERGTWRVVFPVNAHSSEDAIFDEQSVQTRLQGFHRRDEGYEVFHRNLYSVHQRVASCYRDGRLLIAGDAAHINNPLGGMGMNPPVRPNMSTGSDTITTMITAAVMLIGMAMAMRMGSGT